MSLVPEPGSEIALTGSTVFKGSTAFTGSLASGCDSHMMVGASPHAEIVEAPLHATGSKQRLLLGPAGLHNEHTDAHLQCHVLTFTGILFAL